MGYRRRGGTARRCSAAQAGGHADRLGFEIAWFAEHRFSNCICPSPLIAARCAGVLNVSASGGSVVAPLYDRRGCSPKSAWSTCPTVAWSGLGGYQPYEFERFGRTWQRAQTSWTCCISPLRARPSATTASTTGAQRHILPVAGLPNLTGDHEFGTGCARAVATWR